MDWIFRLQQLIESWENRSEVEVFCWKCGAHEPHHGLVYRQAAKDLRAALETPRRTGRIMITNTDECLEEMLELACRLVGDSGDGGVLANRAIMLDALIRCGDLPLAWKVPTTPLEPLTLDDAIEHCQEIAKSGCNSGCAENHQRLAEWLQELLLLRKENDLLAEQLQAAKAADSSEELHSSRCSPRKEDTGDLTASPGIPPRR